MTPRALNLAGIAPVARLLTVVLGVAGGSCDTSDAGVATAPTRAPADRIVLKEGRPIVVDEVVSDGFDKIEFKKGNAIGSQPAVKVKAVEYGDTPESYQLAIEKRDAGEFDAAADLFEAAIATPGVRGWIKVQGNLDLAEALRFAAASDATKYAAAVAAYDEVLDDVKTRLRPEALHGRALAHAGSGDLEACKADLLQLKAETTTNRYGPEWLLRAEYALATSLEEAKRPEARQAFDSLETYAKSFSAREDVEPSVREYAMQLAGRSRLARARILVQENHVPEAQREFERIVADESESAGVRAAAQVSAGIALQEQNKLKEAQVAFARVRVLFHGESEAAAEATYRLGVVCEMLGAAEPRGAALAEEYFTEVVNRHPRSPFASKAKVALGGR